MNQNVATSHAAHERRWNFIEPDDGALVDAPGFLPRLSASR